MTKVWYLFKCFLTHNRNCSRSCKNEWVYFKFFPHQEKPKIVPKNIFSQLLQNNFQPEISPLPSPCELCVFIILKGLSPFFNWRSPFRDKAVRELLCATDTFARKKRKCPQIVPRHLNIRVQTSIRLSISLFRKFLRR